MKEINYRKYKTLVMKGITHWLWKRFIEDFFIWSESEEKLERFLERILINSTLILSSLMKNQKRKIDFLDVVIKIREGRISADICRKPKEGYPYRH